jgi:negative regulator of flagellin synthesis FlgM
LIIEKLESNEPRTNGDVAARDKLAKDVDSMMDAAAMDRLIGWEYPRPFSTVGYAPVQGPFTGEPTIDEVDISPAGYELSRIGDDPPVRTGKIAAVRAAIAEGTYETPEKIDLAIAALLREI